MLMKATREAQLQEGWLLNLERCNNKPVKYQRNASNRTDAIWPRACDLLDTALMHGATVPWNWLCFWSSYIFDECYALIQPRHDIPGGRSA